MIKPTPSEVLHLGIKKRKLQRACDICRGGKVSHSSTLWGSVKVKSHFFHRPGPCVLGDTLNQLSFGQHFAGRFWDILRDLAGAGIFPESHASPLANNKKRVYESDEPMEPPPDETSKASPNGRSFITGSKRVPLPLASAHRGATPGVDDKNVSLPTSTTPDTQEIQEDPSILSVAGSIPKIDGLETSGSSSSGTLAGIFDGDAM